MPKLLKALVLALGLLSVSAAILLGSLRGAHFFGVLAGAVATTFFGPILLVLLHAIVRPNYLVIGDRGLRFRFYSVELTVPWESVREIGGGVGWPSLTFHDCETVARSATVRGWPPVGWLLQLPTGLVSLLLRQPLANLYPVTLGQLLQAFRANERMFRFHYGMPSDLLEKSNKEILALLRARRPRTPRA
jgi:hypothetical protein